EADRLGIGCDFTFSTSWPFGGSIVPEEDAGQVFGGPATQRLEKSWELSYYGRGRILNHLDAGAFSRYAEQVGGALKPALRGTTSGLFSDSWEVYPEGLWSAHLDPVFRDRFGYDLEPFKATIDRHPDVRYDYRKILSQAAIEGFFRPFAETCRRLGAVSRAQCHGAPADLLAAFALVDVPESEALLFETFFSAIPGSAAALGSRPVVTCETFTCIYGYAPWPAPSPHHGEEKVEDMKLMADAVFANGVNHIVWHGMPYNAPGGNNTFYATTHVGPDSGFARRLPAFNAYMTEAADFVKQGRTYTDVAVYLPLEDHWMRHMLPEDRRGPAANYYWELQTVQRPGALLGYHPLWITTPFLQEAVVVDGRVRYGEAMFSVLYVDVEWLDGEALAALLRLAREGAHIVIPRRPAAPGHRPPTDYEDRLGELMSQSLVTVDPGTALRHPPLVSGRDVPEFWCREVDGDHHVFFAHPDTKRIRYPMAYEGWRSTGSVEREIVLHVNGRERAVRLAFEPEDSMLVRVSASGAVEVEPGRVDE
ncbi:MAG: glycosyl hydrolase, partial [Gemmatimonadetes bacterium]|nr:glycosyl hydrolase [Gemmatimonadota bacterium]